MSIYYAFRENAAQKLDGTSTAPDSRWANHKDTICCWLVAEKSTSRYKIVHGSSGLGTIQPLNTHRDIFSKLRDSSEASSMLTYERAIFLLDNDAIMLNAKWVAAMGNAEKFFN